MKRFFRVLVPIVMAMAVGVNKAYAVGDEIIFSTAPTHSAEETRRLYTPLVQYLSQVTGKTIILDEAHNFVEYQNKMRAGKYDFVFDGPHFVGWRMERLNHEPLARFPGIIRIVVIGDENSHITSLEDDMMINQRVCAFASPNMLTMAFLSHYPNPIRQPFMLRIQGFNNVIECVRSRRGTVAVLRDKLWERLENKDDLKLIAAPQRGYPERTFSISRDVDPEVRKAIAEALVSEEGQRVLKPVLDRFKKPGIIPAKASEYEGLGELLRPIWGYYN